MAVFVSFSDETSGGDHLADHFRTGFVGPERDWEESFVPAWKWRVLEGPPKIPYLHMTEIRSPKFRDKYGLSEHNAEQRVDEAFRVINSMGSIFPIGCGLNAGHLRKVFDPYKIVRQKSKQKSYYRMEPDYLSFITYTLTVLVYVGEKYPECEKVDFVVEDNGAITDRMKDFHTHMPGGLDYIGFPTLKPLLGELIPASKERIPLQAADLLSWYTRRFRANQLDGPDLERYGVLAPREGSLCNITNDELTRMGDLEPGAE
jgi:hypothetical protein